VGAVQEKKLVKISFFVDKKLYEALQRKVREGGYLGVSEYLRELLRRELGVGEG